MKSEKDKTEYLIMEAAEKLFIEQGFSKTTTAQIAKKAGCNQALVHYYYRTKENLFEKIYESKLQLIFTNFSARHSEGKTFEEKIIGIIETHYNFLQQNPQLIPFMINEMLNNPERVNSLYSKFKQYAQSILPQLNTELKNEIKKGHIQNITLTDLLFDILPLNAFPFLIAAIVQKVPDIQQKDIQKIIETRKEEVIKTILARLKK